MSLSIENRHESPADCERFRLPMVNRERKRVAVHSVAGEQVQWN